MIKTGVALTIALSSTTLLTSSQLYAHDDGKTTSHGAISHAPIGVMGDHLHKQGGIMFSYRFMNMHMDGMRSGTHEVSAEQVSNTRNPLAGETMRMGNTISTIPPFYRISPVEMDMKMHMFGVMYGLSDNITLTGMLNYQENEMTLKTFGGGMSAAMNGGGPVVGTFKSKASGVSDTKLSAMIKLKDTPTSKIHYNIGISLPTGSITQAGSVLTPGGMNVSIDRLGYPMQLGSGSYDLLPGITYNGYKDDIGWGAQLSGVFRLNENNQNYRLGNKVEITTWLAKQWKPSLSTSVRVTAKTEGSIRGRDAVITGGMPLFYAPNSGRDEVDLHMGLNLLGQQGSLKGHRIALEVGGPLYEKVNGLQMSNDWSVTLGWQKAF